MSQTTSALALTLLAVDMRPAAADEPEASLRSNQLASSPLNQPAV